MRASVGDPQEPRAGDSGSRLYAEYHEGGQPWKKFVYVEPPRRVKEVLEEELYFRRDECRVKHPSEVALEGIWSLRRNFPVGAFQPTVQNPNNLLSQPKYYSRHAVVRRSNWMSQEESGPHVFGFLPKTEEGGEENPKAVKLEKTSIHS